jgi:hypothetical protein
MLLASCQSPLARTKGVFDVDIIKELFDVYNFSRTIESFGHLHIEKKILDKIDINTIIDDFTSRNIRRNF